MDGNLLARTPVSPPFSANDGDFIQNDNAPGSGGFVFNTAGIPVDTSMAFHIIDGYDAADADIFTNGSKFNQDPNTWSWKHGKAPGKDDVNNVLFFFSNDTLGNIWFVGSGDRNKTNGNTYLDFELLQNPLYQNPDMTFTSYGPDGGRTMGDLAVTVEYTIGGSYPQLYVYQWSEISAGMFEYIAVIPAEGTAYYAMNEDSAIAVPYGAFGSDTYPIGAFTEVAVNLNDLVAGMNACLGIKTVLVKTKASQSINAALKDVVGPVQVDISSSPVISVNSPTICFGDTAVLTATVLSGTGPFTYLWNTGDTTPSILVSPDTTTQYNVVVTGANGCPSDTAFATVTVLPLPPCDITGPDTLCPLGTAQFYGPDSLSSYMWTVYGPAMIIGDTSAQMVEIQATGSCDTTFILELYVTGDNGCTSMCSMTVALVDTIPPLITYVPDSMFLQCASEVPPASPDSIMVTDNCAGDIMVMVSDSIMNDTLCPNQFTLIRTWTAMDTCGNVSTASQFISVFDSIPPVLYDVPADTGVCCADSIPPPANVTANDNCDGAVDVTLTEIVSDSTSPMYFTLTRIWTASDTCYNMVADTQVIIVNDTLYGNGTLLSNQSLNDIITYFRISPNPFTNNTRIQFSLARDARISLELYNSMGIMIRSIFSGEVNSGVPRKFELTADGRMAPGMYLLVLRTPFGSETRHVILQ